jgi:hypothetical protein
MTPGTAPTTQGTAPMTTGTAPAGIPMVAVTDIRMA